MDKNTIQQLSVDYSNKHNFLLLEHATGVGKSLSTIKIIDKHKGKWIIIVAELLHIENWKNEFIKHSKEYLLSDVIFSCYASLHKHLKGVNYVFDECHHMFSPKRYALANRLKSNRIVFLSATLTRTQKEKLVAIYPKLFMYKYSLTTAIAEELLPTPKIFLLECKLDTISSIHKYQISKDRSIMCTEQEYYDRLCQRVEFFKDKYYRMRDEFDKIKWLSSGNNRKKFLAKCKTRYARQLLRKLNGKRLICFCNSIEQSETLSAGYGAIHSKISKELRESLLFTFNEEISDRLFVVGMLREGVNLTNIEAGVIVQLDNQEKSYMQMQGQLNGPYYFNSVKPKSVKIWQYRAKP